MKTTFPAPSANANPVDQNRPAISAAGRESRSRRDSEAGRRHTGDVREQSSRFIAVPEDFSIEPWPHGGLNE